MSEERAPIIEVTPRRLMCPGHGEHLAEQWPKGFAFVSMTILEAALSSDDLHEVIRRMGGVNDKGLANPEYINLITQRRPFCYFVTRDVIRNALGGADIGRIGLCQICGRSGIGGPYRVADLVGNGFQKLPHVCFECALDTGERMHTAYPTGHDWE